MSKLKHCKAMADKALKALYNVEATWEKAGHGAKATYYVHGHKFTYGVDSTPKAAYTLDKTIKNIKASNMQKALQWGYINDLAEFEAKFLN